MTANLIPTGKYLGALQPSGVRAMPMSVAQRARQRTFDAIKTAAAEAVFISTSAFFNVEKSSNQAVSRVFVAQIDV